MVNCRMARLPNDVEKKLLRSGFEFFGLLIHGVGKRIERADAEFSCYFFSFPSIRF